MTDRPPPASAVGRDFDAYRRSRTESGPSAGDEVLDVLDALAPTDDPVVAITRMLDAMVPLLWDGGEVELAVEGEAPVRHRATRSIDVDADVTLFHLRLSCLDDGGTPLGLMSWWCTGARDAQDERLIAGLVVRTVLRGVDHQRALRAGVSMDGRAAQLAVDGITGRRISLAVGVLVQRLGIAETDAEDVLRRSAVEHGRSMFDEAFHVVADAAAPIAESPSARDVSHLRDSRR